MKWRTKEQRRTDRERELTARGWHRTFCWVPFAIKGHVYWMTFVERKYMRYKRVDGFIEDWYVMAWYREVKK